jgi:hypothetical protein
VRRELTELSRNSTILVANCSGAYIPFEPSGAGQRVHAGEWLDDRALRN